MRLAADVRMSRQLAPAAATSWVEVVVRVAPVDVEAVADALRAVSPAGVSIEPAIRTLDHDNFQYELLDEPATLRVSLPGPLTPSERRGLRRRLTRMPLTAPLARIRYREVRDQDWAEEWKRFFTVQHIGRRIVIRPSWETYEAEADEVVIDLDPGTAFGTGQHQTTRLCLAALEQYVRPGATVLDVGTGSGILAIAAALLGASQVRACDTDANAVVAADANVERNGVAAAVDCLTGSLGEDWPWPERFRGKRRPRGGEHLVGRAGRAHAGDRRCAAAGRLFHRQRLHRLRPLDRRGGDPRRRPRHRRGADRRRVALSDRHEAPYLEGPDRGA